MTQIHTNQRMYYFIPSCFGKKMCFTTVIFFIGQLLCGVKSVPMISVKTVYHSAILDWFRDLHQDSDHSASHGRFVPHHASAVWRKAPRNRTILRLNLEMLTSSTIDGWRRISMTMIRPRSDVVYGFCRGLPSRLRCTIILDLCLRSIICDAVVLFTV